MIVHMHIVVMRNLVAELNELFVIEVLEGSPSIRGWYHLEQLLRQESQAVTSSHPLSEFKNIKIKCLETIL